MMKLEIERTQSDEKPLPISITYFLEKLKQDNEMYGCELVYSNMDKAYRNVKWMISEFNEKQRKKAKTNSKRKFKRTYPELHIGSGSSHIWIHIQGDHDRVAILREE